MCPSGGAAERTGPSGRRQGPHQCHRLRGSPKGCDRAQCRLGCHRCDIRRPPPTAHLFRKLPDHSRPLCRPHWRGFWSNGQDPLAQRAGRYASCSTARPPCQETPVRASSASRGQPVKSPKDRMWTVGQVTVGQNAAASPNRVGDQSASARASDSVSCIRELCKLTN